MELALPYRTISRGDLQRTGDSVTLKEKGIQDFSGMLKGKLLREGRCRLSGGCSSEVHVPPTAKRKTST